MKQAIEPSHLIHRMSNEKYVTFCLRLKDYVSGELNLFIFKDKAISEWVTQGCADLFSDEIQAMRLLLNDNEVGLVALDVPEAPQFTPIENNVCGVAVVTGLFNNLAEAHIDTMNQLPFMLHTASHSNEHQLESKGLEAGAPTMKLGFHNDGLLSDTTLEIPQHVMVYNLYLAYQRPGHFMWVPTALWQEAEKYQTLATEDNIRVKIKLTPNYHQDEQGELTNTMFNYIETPIGLVNQEGQSCFFLNGQVLPEDNLQKHVELVQAMRDSLENNPVKMAIPQHERRAFYIKNSAGFHARSLFEEPVEDVDLTRVYIRAVDVNSEKFFS